MNLKELKNRYSEKELTKHLYWQISREGYLRLLSDIQMVVSENTEVDSIVIGKDGVVLDKSG